MRGSINAAIGFQGTTDPFDSKASRRVLLTLFPGISAVREAHLFYAVISKWDAPFTV